MAKKPEPPALSSFDVYKLAKKAMWLATIEATDERDAIGPSLRPSAGPAVRTETARHRRHRSNFGGVARLSHRNGATGNGRNALRLLRPTRF